MSTNARLPTTDDLEVARRVHGPLRQASDGLPEPAERLSPMATEKPTDPRTGVPGRNADRGKNPVRGVRIEESLWAAVKMKAEAEGTNRNAVIVALLRGYVSGAVRPPQG